MNSIFSEQEQNVAFLMEEMKATAAEMRTLIVSMPPEELLGYIQSRRLLVSIKDADIDGSVNSTSEIQFLLEYVHAVLASDIGLDKVEFDESKCTKLFDLSSKLRNLSMCFAARSSAISKNKEFGSNTSDIEYHIKSSWVSLRGNRYQVLEEEFYNYVLAPHDDVLKEHYGVGSTEVAKGFQSIANAARVGHGNAIKEIMEFSQEAKKLSLERGQPFEEAIKDWISENVGQSNLAALAIDNLFYGGVSNVTRHTDLPSKLLEDLAYKRGEEKDFFSQGDFSGTPFRTLPARKKPLIKLGREYYAIDYCFIRDSGYRSLLFNLLQRNTSYRKLFNDRQKVMSEEAFPDILIEQLPGATVFQEVYYKDPMTGKWVENDTLIIVDDVLYLVEAKSGAAATIASPELDFERHAQSVKDLIIKAYKQCERFFKYLKSADEVSLYTLEKGKYKECGRIRYSDFRVMIPIGLTVESLSPLASFCKELPQIQPILGKHAFLSMSIDDLFVLRRILPTSGVFTHYMEVRQSVAGIKRGYLFDEIDHLGAYIKINRFDEYLKEQLTNNQENFVILSDTNTVIDSFFSGREWENNLIPTQEFPDELLELLESLDTNRAKGWLAADSLIRNYDKQARNDFADLMSRMKCTVESRSERFFVFFSNGQPLFVFMKSKGKPVDWNTINDKAKAFALSIDSPEVAGLFVEISKSSSYENAQYFKVEAPLKKSDKNTHIFDNAQKIRQKTREISLQQTTSSGHEASKIGRNDLCPCGSGTKYKKCHGR